MSEREAGSVPQQAMQIGHVAERIGLSLRTIRYYEEVGLITPSGRSQGGFRLYADRDVRRLQLVKDMKPLGFSLDEMRDLLAVLDRLESLDHQAASTDQAGAEDDDIAAEREALVERLTMFRIAADARCDALRAELRIATSFAEKLRHGSQLVRGRTPKS